MENPLNEYLFKRLEETKDKLDIAIQALNKLNGLFNEGAFIQDTVFNALKKIDEEKENL